jgi:hypothetical protein
MTWYLNRWSALAVWAVMMMGLWLALVPAVLSASSLAVLALAGPVLMIAASTLRNAHAPTPSVGQAQATPEAAASAGQARR